LFCNKFKYFFSAFYTNNIYIITHVIFCQAGIYFTIIFRSLVIKKSNLVLKIFWKMFIFELNNSQPRELLAKNTNFFLINGLKCVAFLRKIKLLFKFLIQIIYLKLEYIFTYLFFNYRSNPATCVRLFFASPKSMRVLSRK